MQESSQTPPPPLYYSPTVSDRGRDSTSENTPVHTPTTGEAPWPTPFGPPKREKDLYFSWHRKPGSAKHQSNPLLGSDWHFAPDPEELLFEDDGDTAFPLFPDSPPRSDSFKMASSALPIDISLPPRLNSQSPRNQTSNLTFALQEAAATGQHASEIPNGGQLVAPESGRLSVSGRHDSISNAFGSSYYGSGARPISVKERQRRESNTGGSFMGGMSWGGISVGSWVRDDIIMAGTSPAQFGKSPSLHSSSYLPKMEANFLRDYKCCGITLDSLHELLQHFEENHAQPSNQVAHRSSTSSQSGLGATRRPSNGMSTGDSSRGFAGFDQSRQQQQQQQQQQQTPRSTTNQQSLSQARDGFNRTQLSTVQDMDTLEDMELDDSTLPSPAVPQHRTQFGQGSAGIPPLNTSLAGNVPAQQAFRTSTPTTPSANQAFSLFSNPTVSSVNTPALSTQSIQQAQKSPESSIPGTPAELDTNFAGNLMGGDMFSPFPSGNNQMMQDNFEFGNIGFGLSNNMNEMTIDEPAKRLFSKQGGMNNQQLAYAMKNGQVPMDSELAKRLREQQLVGGLGGPIVGFPEPESKPFKCPVIGCEKAYKNQNGLKYHKQHGHQNQKLKENEDGTFSIVDPVTSIPYPGTVGMEKEKPYRCEVCGKRYKNLNGLKYHRQHSPPCNPDLKLNPLAGLSGNLQGLNPNANIAGAGLVGMGDANLF